MTSASSDYKIITLEDKHGHLGYSFYWKIVEMMGSQWSGFGDPEIETNFRYLRQFLRTQEPKIKVVLEDMRQIGLLDYSIFDKKLVIKMDALKKIRDNSSQKSIDNRGIKRELKEYIVQRDMKQCSYCDETLSGQSLNFDHFIPFSLGGGSGADNIVLSCDKCNKIKGMAHPDEIEKGCYPFSNRIEKVRTKLSLERDKELDKEIEVDKIKKNIKKNTSVVEDKSSNDLPRLAIIWNENCGKLTKVVKTNQTRNKKAAERLKEDDEDGWIEAVKKLSASQFCNGFNDRGWKATFDFILQPEARLKILEGFYDGRSGKKFKNERDFDADEEFQQILQGVKDGIRANG